MKVVLACEGNCEVKLMLNLLEKDALIFNKRDILDQRPLKLRQPKTIAPIINTLPEDEEIIFYRIGDTQRDTFNISCFGLTRIEHITVIKICTMPEIEILIIINEGKYTEYLKEKSESSPKDFIKIHLGNIASFEEYIKTNDMTYAIREYKRIKKHKQKDEQYLADLLK